MSSWWNGKQIANQLIVRTILKDELVLVSAAYPCRHLIELKRPVPELWLSSIVNDDRKLIALPEVVVSMASGKSEISSIQA